jgi:hypothetical protein
VHDSKRRRAAPCRNVSESTDLLKLTVHAIGSSEQIVDVAQAVVGNPEQTFRP